MYCVSWNSPWVRAITPKYHLCLHCNSRSGSNFRRCRDQCRINYSGNNMFWYCHTASILLTRIVLSKQSAAKQILYIIYVAVLEHKQITTVRKYRFRIMLNYDLFFSFLFLTKKHTQTNSILDHSIQFVWNITYFPCIS